MSVKGLTLFDFSDRDLLFALEDAADDEGWATSREVAIQIGIEHSNPSQCVGSRFAWLKRFGIMEAQIREGETFWRLNKTGESLLHPTGMGDSLNKALAKLNPGQRLKVTQIISQQIAKDSSKKRSAAHLSTRAWRHSLGTWRDSKVTAKRKV